MFLKFFLMLSFIYSFSYADTFLDKERLQASKEKKLILLSISSEHCPYCIKMKKNIQDLKLNKLSENLKLKILR